MSNSFNHIKKNTSRKWLFQCETQYCQETMLQASFICFTWLVVSDVMSTTENLLQMTSGLVTKSCPQGQSSNSSCFVQKFYKPFTTFNKARYLVRKEKVK